MRRGPRKAPQPLAQVLAIPGSSRPEDAFKFLVEAHAAGKLRGVIMGLVLHGEDGNLEMHFCGDVSREKMTFMGAVLMNEGGG